jgi:hypothetical protein
MQGRFFKCSGDNMNNIISLTEAMIQSKFKLHLAKVFFIAKTIGST